MKKLYVALICLLWATVSFAQNNVSGNINTSSSGCAPTTGTSCVSLNLPFSAGGVGIAITDPSASFSGTLQLEATANNGGSWVSTGSNCTNVATGATASSATGAATFQCNLAGMNGVRVRASAYSAGFAAVNIQQGTGSARNGGGGGSLPSGTQGYNLVNKNGSTGYQTVGNVIETGAYTSQATMAQAAAAAMQAAAANYLPGVVIDSRGEFGTRSGETGTGEPTIDIDPYLAGATPLQVLWLLPCGPINQLVPLAETTGAPSSTNAYSHGNIKTLGCGVLGNIANVSAGNSGTTLIAGATYPICVANTAINAGGGSPVWSCTDDSSATMSSHHYTGGPFGTYGATVLTPGGTGFTFTAANIGMEAIVGNTCPGSSTCTYGIITSLINTNTPTYCASGATNPCAVIISTLGTTNTLSGVNFILKSAQGETGVASQLSANDSSYGLRFEGMTFDAQGLAGVDCLANWYGVEETGWSYIHCQHYNDIGMDIEGLQAQASGPYGPGLFLVPDASTETAKTLDVVVRNAPIRIFTDWSLAENSATTRNYCFAVDSGGGIYGPGHQENCGLTGQFAYGSAPPCAINCPVAVPTTIGGTTLQQIDGSCADGSCLTVLDINGNSGTSITGLKVGVLYESVANLTNLLVDHATARANTLTTANNPVITCYNIDNAGYVSCMDANTSDGPFKGIGLNVNATKVATGALTVTPLGTSAVGLIVNNPSGTSADVADFQVNGSTVAKINSTGALSLSTGGSSQITLNGSSSGSATLGVSATGSVLDLNGTSATIDSSGNADFNSIPAPGVIGGTTPAAATFTTVTANTSITCTAAHCLGSATATTQSAGDNSTKVATTAYVNGAATFTTWLANGANLGGTGYCPITGAGNCHGTESDAQSPMPRAYSITNLYVFLNADEPSASSLAVTVRTCTPSGGPPTACTGSSTAVTCTVATGTNTCSYTGTAATGSAGDVIDLLVVGSGSTSTTYGGVSFTIQ